MLRFDDRFARQNRYEPPPKFPLASPYPSIVHHLSGPIQCALSESVQYKTSLPDPIAEAPRDPLIGKKSLSLRIWVYLPNTRTLGGLLGPCFKTGHIKPFRQQPVTAFLNRKKSANRKVYKHPEGLPSLTAYSSLPILVVSDYPSKQSSQSST